jgi:hypothetical protein
MAIQDQSTKTFPRLPATTAMLPVSSPSDQMGISGTNILKTSPAILSLAVSGYLRDLSPALQDFPLGSEREPSRHVPSRVPDRFTTLGPPTATEGYAPMRNGHPTGGRPKW